MKPCTSCRWFSVLFWAIALFCACFGTFGIILFVLGALQPVGLVPTIALIVMGIMSSYTAIQAWRGWH